MAKTFSIYFLIRIINGVVSLASIYILTRLLNAEQYGVYALGIATIGLISSVLFQWIAVAVSRFYMEHIDNPRVLLNEANWLLIRISIFCFLVTIIGSLFIPKSIISGFAICAIGLGGVSMGWYSLSIQVANAQRQPLRYGMLTIFRAVIALAITVLFIYLNMDGSGAILGFAFASAITVIIFKKNSANKIEKKNPVIRRNIVIYGLPLVFSYFSIIVLDVSDRFMIGYYLGPVAVAGYAASYDLSQQTVGAILNIFSLGCYPKVIAAWEIGGAEMAKKAMIPLSRAILLIAPLLVAIFFGMATDISNFFFGKNIGVDAAKVMPWVAVAIAIGCFKSYYLDVAFQLKKTTRVQTYIALGMALLNIILNIILIPNFGIFGAALATVAAFMVGAFISWYCGRSLKVYPITKIDILYVLIAFVILLFIVRVEVQFLDIHWLNKFLKLSVGVTLYFAIILVTNAVEFRETFKSIFKYIKF